MDIQCTPFFANAFQFALDKATIEGKFTIGLLAIVSLFSWTVIITKGRQLYRANKAGKKFFAAYRATRDPLDLFNRKEDFTGAPAFEVYAAGTEELAYHLKNNPVTVKARPRSPSSAGQPAVALEANTDFFARSIVTKISHSSFESVKVSLERAVSRSSDCSARCGA
jgi:hypothetical protein